MISEEAMQRMRSKVQQKVTATPPGTWAKVGVGVLVGGVAIGWIAFPYVLDKVVASQINLAQGKDSRKLWVQLPTFDCYIYVFNITNPAEVMQGAKPVVQEIGPYCYKEVKDKTDFVEDPTSDTISYSARNTWYEDQQNPSCPAPQLTGEELLLVPNVPLLSVLLLAEKDFPAPFLTLVNQALPAIFGRFNDLFMRVTARRLLFDGILVNCTASALYPRAVCIALKQNSKALKKLGENVYSFSFFGAKNHTAEEFRYSVKRGTVDGQDIGRLVALDGKPELPFWRGECNKIQGTDASVFPPFRKMENGSLTAYSSEICRIIFGIYEGQEDYKGVRGYAYTANFGDVESNPGDRCYCPADDRCRKKGVLDALKCQGAPLVTSQPHFYQASRDYVDGVIGLSPDKDKHGIRIVLEPISGSPLIVRKRIQFNIEMKPVRFVPLSQRLRRSLVPLFWAEETLDLDGDLMGMLEASLFRPIRAVDVIKWLCVVGGVALGILGIVLKVRKNRRDKVHTINRIDGREFGYDGDSKTTPRPEKFVISEEANTDPFYVDTEKKESNKNEIKNGVNPVIVKKSASTMTTPNGSRSFSLAKLDVQQFISNGTMDKVFKNNIPTPKYIIESYRDLTQMHPDEEQHTASGGLLSYNGLSGGENRNLGVSNSFLKYEITSSEGNLENEPRVHEFHSPKLNASLEHQMTFRTPTSVSPSVATEPFESTPDLQMSNHNNQPMQINENSKRDKFEQSSMLKDGDELSSEGKFNDNAELGIEADNTVVKDETSAFEDLIENRPEEPQSKSKTTENEIKVIIDDDTGDFEPTQPNEPQQEYPSQENKQSDEEIKAVEDDMKKLIAEIAELLPRNKSFSKNDQK